ncbi:cellulose synthase catalytic subunit (UDP-forming) [Bacterioplanes sanyensis]|uniref:Cellulose synthase catalytic subunit [UDP-forming] n=1 Tax=Bacterioplanes sanyensis TaxID=1249553 RepID=A0A222FHE0_9GAMM|nr:UDP-forming cellulose synthase catalytic subunit [Bacterioplanes sanyensis]ASP37996.1 cellulose synthase catalytic subunit (UDP-forming) [Bacterioplanes sanyensis]
MSLTTLSDWPVRTLWIIAVLLFLWLASLPLLLLPQYLLAGCALLAFYLLSRLTTTPQSLHRQGNSPLRVLVILLAVFLTLRYFFWRTFNTLPDDDPFSLIAGLLLYLAELYGILIYLLGAFVNINPWRREPVPLPEDQSLWPTVDIMVPSYNEDADILRITLTAARDVDYPKDKLNVYLCDDGGTLFRRYHHSDPAVREEAHRRHHELRALCDEIGVRYLTRHQNNHAKAGNLNAALEHTHGELILILDADHVPTEDFLQNTAGWFIKDPKLFLLQTPHNFLNPDPIEKNLSTYEKMPSENEMFYGVIQQGLDFWGGTFFCGSAAVLRREYLMQIGGISGDSITEDAETAMDLHSLGYHSAYISKPMVAGLQPETFTGFISQRVRWAQGMMQIFLLKNPWTRPKLSLAKRLAYTSSAGFWFFPFARAIFLVAPLAYFLFGINIYYANLQEMLAYALPHLLAAWGLSNYLFGKVRWPFVSEIYETMQSLFALPGLIKVFKNPRAPSFIVTPKGEFLEDDFISQLAPPFYWFLGLSLIGFAAAIYRYTYYPLDRDVVIVVSAWAVFNFIMLIGALGVLLERKQRRSAPRMVLPEPVPVMFNSATLPPVKVAWVHDASSTGAALEAWFQSPPALIQGQRVRARYRLAPADDWSELPILVRSVRHVGSSPHQHRYRIGAHFDPRSDAEHSAVVRLLYSSSDQLEHNLARRHQRMTTWRGLSFVTSTALRYGVEHIRFVVLQLLGKSKESHD